MNKHLIRYDLVSDGINLAEYHANAKDLMPVSVDGFTGAISSKLLRLSAVNDSLYAYEQNIQLLQRQSDSLTFVVDTHRDSSITTYKNTLLYPYLHRLDSLDQIIAGLDSTEAVLQGLLIDKTQLQLAYTVKKEEVLEYIIKNYQFFIPNDERDVLHDYSSAIISNIIEKSSLELKRIELARSIKEDVALFHKNRCSSVDFMDFLYYSICVSTTVSFGDIAPNNGLTRIIAILELLSCIVLVSLIIAGLMKKEN